MRIELVTTLKRRATALLSEVDRDKEPVLIMQHGLPSAYILDALRPKHLASRIKRAKA